MRSAAAAATGGGASSGAASGGATAAPASTPVSTADPDPPSLATPAASDPAPASVSDPDPATSDPATPADPATPVTNGLIAANGISAGGPTEVDNVPGTAQSSGMGSGVGTTGTSQVRAVYLLHNSCSRHQLANGLCPEWRDCLRACLSGLDGHACCEPLRMNSPPISDPILDARTPARHAQGLGLASNRQSSTGSTGLGIGTGSGIVSGTGTGSGSGSGNGVVTGKLQSSLSNPLALGAPTSLPTGGLRCAFVTRHTSGEGAIQPTSACGTFGFP